MGFLPAWPVSMHLRITRNSTGYDALRNDRLQLSENPATVAHATAEVCEGIASASPLSLESGAPALFLERGRCFTGGPSPPNGQHRVAKELA
jgi:hypothetical protein